ncbi:endonuclease III [Candidatus Woesearchaeota archaeon]|jgi:endonuclease-3|nr:endonuclease III [Candidatus Woesearchaeota archaeon]MBT4150658.1 endonuclease III [Candidatus Woesearchaeota archaeon]MBT4247876.1 endonuclease III [Candidatus Woesearchaeota archaeon]MBT4434300.1 endonuclease III [Candidatus Woesearchaeota archaeon]MBT7331768.1 endonuclease III [Candidatus Woesearchaeota archaeon]
MPSLNEMKTVFSLLESTHPETMLEELGHYPVHQMLIMTLLSARAKDSTVIPIVKEFFKKHPTIQEVADLPIEYLEKAFFKCGFYRMKSKHVKLLCQKLLDEFNGTVPDTLEELTSLPGVGRKTANCILAYAFGKPAIAVDIHVHRIANRLGWISTKNEKESEFALMDLVPKDQWINVNRLLVGHGQSICAPRKPDCDSCNITEHCKYGREKNV